MDSMKMLSDNWFPVAGLIGLIAWFVRLESKILYLEKDHENQKHSNNKKDSAMWDKMNSIQSTMNDIQQSLARIEGRMEHKGDN